MPPRLDLFMKRWSLFDLPILPFLAPRVFQPWPNAGRRIHSRTTQAAQQQSGAVGEVYDDSPQDNGGRRGWFMGPTAQKCGAFKMSQEFNLSPTNAASLEYNWLQEPGGSPGAESSETVEDEEFRRKYEEIWGFRIQKATPPAPVRRVQCDENRRGEKRGVSYNISNIVIHSGERIWYRRPVRRDQARERKRQQWLNGVKAMLASNRRQLRFRAQNEADRRKIPMKRPKWARYLLGSGSSLYAPFSSWHRRFAILNLRHEKFMKGRILPRLATQQTSKFPATLIRELIEQESSITLRLEWEKIGPRRKMEIWPELMIKTLQHHPDKALKMIAGTYAQEPFPPSYAVSDCLQYIISHFIGRTRSLSMNFVRHLCNYIFRLLRVGPKDYLHISQHSIFLLLSNADNYCVKKLYEILADLNHPLHQNTLMNFASRLATSGEIEIVFKILGKLKSLDCDFNSPKMLSLCSAILDRSNRGPNTTCSDSDIFEYMLECGMQPNLITYNVLMQNSLEVGNHSTAWQIHDMMIESGVEPDAYTYSILLNDSKQRMDSADIRRVMDMVRERDIRSAYIVTDVLHAIFLLHQQRTKTYDQPSEPQTAFHNMLKVYLENFRIEPLLRIVPWISENLPDVQSSETSTIIQVELEYPPSPTLELMIAAFVHGLQNPWSVRHFYNHFRNLLSTGDPVLVDLIPKTYIWNSILMAFGRFPETREDCPTVIGDMLAPITAATMNSSSLPTEEIERESALGSSPVPEASIFRGSKAEYSTDLVQPLHASSPTQDSKSHQPETPEEHLRTPYIPPKPDVYTWSILLKIFMDQQQTRAAERVLTMMQEKGVQPNLVTWNTLVAGYARLQDPRMTVDVISRLEDSGLKPNDITMASLYKIRDRRGLLEAMRRKEQRMVNPGKAFLDQLQDDVRNTTRGKLSPDSQSKDDEDFVVKDVKEFDKDVTTCRISDDSDTQKEAGEDVETRW